MAFRLPLYLSINMDRALRRAKRRSRFATKVVRTGAVRRPNLERRPTTREQSVYVTAPLC